MPIDQTTQRLLQTFAPQQSASVSDVPELPEDNMLTSAPAQPPAPAQVVSPAQPTQSVPQPVSSVVSPEPPTTQSTPVIPTPTPSQDDELALLDQILAEAEQTAPQAVPTAMLQSVADATQALTPKTGTGGKETIGAAAGAKNVVEAGGSTQYVEYEPNPELPPEVEGYLNKAEQHSDQAPPEIVIADSAAALPTDRQLPSQPVVVLPITPEVEKIGMSKPPQFSIRWLVEWSHKIMKMFVGNVIYFQKK